MRYLFWIILLFVFTSFDLAAQSVRFSMGVGIGSVSDYLDERNQIYEGPSYLFLMDSMYEVSEVKQEFHITTQYKSKMQFSIFGSADFRLGRKMEIGTGLGLSRFTFRSTYGQTGTILTKVIKDTLSIEALPVFQQKFGCDSSAYIPPVGYNSRPDYALIDLRIPLLLKYELFSGFKVDLGGQLVTPIYSGQPGSKTVTQRHEEGGKTICVSTHKTYRDHTGKGFRQMRWSLLGGASYRINSKLEVSFLLEKNMQSVFISGTEILDKAAFKPVSARMGLSYYLGASKKIKQSAN